MKILIKTLCLTGFLILMTIGVNAVVINEINYDAASTPQFIELYNLTSSPIDLESWEIQAAGTSFSTVATLPSGATIPANGYYLISAGTMAPTPDNTNAGLVLDNTVSTDVAGVRLRDDSQNVIDTTLYGYSTGVLNTNGLQDDLGSVDPTDAALDTAGTCSSISRSPAGTDTDVSFNDFFELSMSPTNSAGQTSNPCSGVPITVAEYVFGSDEESWGTGGASPTFELPTFSYDSGSLKIQSVDTATDLYGYWESPRDEIPFVEDSIYKTTFTVRSDQTDKTLVPQFRIHMRSQSETIGGMITYQSFYDSDIMPDTTAQDYVLYFDPMNLESLQEGVYSGDFEAVDDLYLAFDMVNFRILADSDAAALYIDNVLVERFDKAAMEGGTTVKVYDSTADFANWVRDGASPTYEEPNFEDVDGGIRIVAPDTANRYGYVENLPSAAEVSIETGKLYRVLFTASSTETSVQPRFRISTNTFKETYMISTLHSYDGINVPQAGGTTYQGFFYPPQNDDILLVGIDLVNFWPTHGANLTVSRVEIQTLDATLVP